MIAVWVYATYSGRYLTWFDIVALAMIAPATVLLLAIFLIEGVEMAVNLWLGQSQPPAHPAAGARHLEAAQGFDPRAVLQRAAGDDDRDHPRAREAGLCATTKS